MAEGMQSRQEDGSVGDVNYGIHGVGYSHYRRPDPAISAQIEAALGTAKTVLNVGAGAGSYEPVTTRQVTAVEPSAAMRAQRPPGYPTALDATSEELPFPDDSFDAAMATFTIHQWSDVEKGLKELRRVTRGPVVILTCAPEMVDEFWLGEYTETMLEHEAGRFPSIEKVVSALGGKSEVLVARVPFDCTDGFLEAYYGRPEMFLDKGARRAQSSWTFVGAEAEARFVERLRTELDSGEWDAKYGHLRKETEFKSTSLRLIIATK